jgi:16S rRNA (adenine1518-N6/adenine1519-N6)-dimethyltransferase
MHYLEIKSLLLEPNWSLFLSFFNRINTTPMDKVKAKKHLGQHFLIDESIAKAIADTLNLVGYQSVLEIGPGMGVLTKYLIEKPIITYAIEIDTESVVYLQENYPALRDKIISKDFLKFDLNEI